MILLKLVVMLRSMLKMKLSWRLFYSRRCLTFSRMKGPKEWWI